MATTFTAADKRGNDKVYPTSGSHTVTLDNTLNVTYAYDEAGNMTQKSEEGGSKITTYTYNDQNQLTQITFLGTPSRWQKFYYDGLGRRVQLEYYRDASPDPVLICRQKFVYLGGSVIRELDDSEPTPQVVREYIRGGGLGGGIGSIIYCKEGSDYYFFHYNHKGDVVSVTDGDKNEVAYYEYHAWGNMMTEAGTWRSPYCFATKERDYGMKDADYEYKTGLIYFGARYYSPEIARWTQRDPVGIVDGLNLYVYVNDEPVAGVDVWGRLNGGHSWTFMLPKTTACDVWYFMAGYGGFYDLTGIGGGRKSSNYWLEIRVPGQPNEKLEAGENTQGSTFPWQWKKSVFKVKSSKRRLEFGKGRSTTCSCANCGQIHDCLKKANNGKPGSLGAKDYDSLFYNCWHYAHELLEKCCLGVGHVVEYRDAPKDWRHHRMRYPDDGW